MKPGKSSLPKHADDEIAALIETLHQTGERLEELTAGEVDTVADRDGRMFLLRHAQEQLRHSEAAKQAAILNALPAHIALLDAQGRIISVNEAWRGFAGANALQNPECGVGVNYLDVCDSVRGTDAAEAQRAAAGIRSVLAGTATSFSLEYSCNSPAERRWFLLAVTPLTDDLQHGVVVMHLDMTAERLSEERYRLLFDSSIDAVLLTATDGRILSANPSACRMFGWTEEEILQGGRARLVDASDPRVAAALEERSRTGKFMGELSFVRKDGARFPGDISSAVFKDKDGELRTSMIIRDMTERKAAEDRISRLNRVYAVLSGINTLIVHTRDRQELFDEACRITVEQGKFRLAWIGLLDANGLDVTPVARAGIDTGYLDHIQLTARDDAPDCCALLKRALQQRAVVICNDIDTDPQMTHWREEALLRGYRSVVAFPLQFADRVSGVLLLYAAQKDFFDTEEMKLLTELAGDISFAIDHIDKQERLDYLAYYDVLTGLANRTLFLERVALYVRSAAGGGHKPALFLVDLEHFKNINDSLGRSAGDALLRQVAEWMTRIAGDANLVARVAADVFAVVLPGVTPDGDLARMLEKMIEAFLEHPFRLNDAVFRIAAKGGVALFPDDGADADTLYRNAEAALKQAKARGERYLFYTQTMTAAVAGNLTLENQLRQALDNEEFVLHYQPKVNLASGKVTGAEALIRWNDPRTGLVPPGRFIPILEETGLIHDVGRWALRQAIADYLRWRAAGLPAVRIAVNVSPLQLRHRGFIAEIGQLIGVDAQAPAGLEIEITESLIMADIKHSIASLQAIRALGISIAIDDFGTGFSSLAYLAKLPVDTLKIDRSFVIEMTAAPEGLALVSTIIKLAHSLKFKVVAEGVETEEQSRLLRLLACDEMQGFLFSKAVPGEIFETRFLAPPGATPPALTGASVRSNSR